MRLGYYIIFLILGCNWRYANNNIDKDLEVESKQLYIRTINQKIKQLEFVLSERGVLIDTSFDKLNEVEKLEFIKKELLGYRIVDNQIVKLNGNSALIEKDSFYIGSASLSGYNSNLNWKLLINIDGTTKEILFDTTFLEFKYKLKPYKIGKNEFNGYLIQGRDTYKFKDVFNVTN